MKKLLPILLCVAAFIGCESDSEQFYTVATPITMTADEMRSAVSFDAPKEIDDSGKIYAYDDLIFINDLNKGVHMIDNSNPSNPVKMAFINIPGNVDISVRGNLLFANSFVDLLVFDLSDRSDVKLLRRLEDVFPNEIIWPVEVDVVEGIFWGQSSEFIVGWDIKEVKGVAPEQQTDVIFAMAEAANASSGTGGSMARFKIVDHILYAVDMHSIHVFNIGTIETIEKLKTVHAGFDIETIFNKDEHLFLGSRSGMFIYDISELTDPQYVAEFQHGTACDPVVVDDQYAYITLRAGNGCGAFDSSLQIVDISDIRQPVLKESYPMNGPYGLGIRNNSLFICDGAAGLKVYDKTDISNLNFIQHFTDIQTYDVIPLEDKLLMVGDGTLYQYSYEGSKLSPLSIFSLNN